jgi:hypothetical protein
MEPAFVKELLDEVVVGGGLRHCFMGAVPLWCGFGAPQNATG